MGRLDGRIAIITGGARGMGAATARRFAAEGANVFIADLRDDLGQAVAAEIGPAARFVHHDVSDETSWAALISLTVKEAGGLDILVNNAGILRFASIEDETPQAFNEILSVNLIGPFLGIRAVVKALRERGGGAIVNLSSTAGATGVPDGAAYASSKWAVRGLTKSAALDLAPDNIRVNSVHPGSTDTPMVADLGFKGGPGNAPNVPLQRVANPEDIASAVLFLASDDSVYMTGTEVYVDGGSLAGPMSRIPATQ